MDHFKIFQHFNMVFSTFVSIENYLPDWSNNSGGPIIQFYSNVPHY